MSTRSARRPTLASLTTEAVASTAAPAAAKAEPKPSTPAERSTTGTTTTGSSPRKQKTRPPAMSLVRKECRITPEQNDTLTLLRRRINRDRGVGEGERITENTLIRVAIDLLLEKEKDLAGKTEDELRQSVGLT